MAPDGLLLMSNPPATGPLGQPEVKTQEDEGGGHGD